MRILRMAALPILLSSAVMAQDQDKVTEHAVSGPAGKEVRAGWFGNLKADCSAGPQPQARVLDSAQNGIIKLRNAKVRSEARNCPNAELPAVAVFYESKPGFVGTDSFTLEVKGESGAPSRHKFNVTVAGMP